MILIKKDFQTRIVIISFTAILLLSALAVINQNNADIESLKTSIKQLEITKMQLEQEKWLLNVRLNHFKGEIDELEAENEQLRTIRAKVTSYSPLDNVDGKQALGNSNKTSTGKIVSRGYAAADPNRLPYGTRLYIPDYGEVEIQDTGSALRANKKEVCIDLYQDTYLEAIKFGVKYLDVMILEWGTEK